MNLVRRPLSIVCLAIVISIAIAVGALVTPVGASPLPHEYDFTYYGAEHTINGAILQEYTTAASSGTGAFDTFLRISAANLAVEAGYNSDYSGKDLEFNEDASWTRSYLLADVPQVWKEAYDGLPAQAYREFQLDINQAASHPLLSLDQLQVWITGQEPSATGYKYADFSSHATLVWQLDFGGNNNYCLLNYGLNPGSGKRDMVAWIPDSLFDSSKTYVVLYSKFGGDGGGAYPNNDGFEEWGVAKYQTATTSGMKFHDLDADDVKDAGEPGLGGWTIYVDYNDNGQKDAGEPFAITSSAAATLGEYTISGIVAGTWKVREDMTGKTGWYCSFPTTTDEYGAYHKEPFDWGMSYPANNFGNYHIVADKANSTTVTQLYQASDVVPVANGGSITLGESVYDVATVTGLPDPYIDEPTGNVVFEYQYKLNSGDPWPDAWTGISTNGLSGGTATSGDFKPGNVGYYRFRAHYTGDSNYNESYSSLETELLYVAATPPPSVSSAPPFPNIYAGIGAALGAGILAYFVHRRLVTPNNI